MNIAPILSLFGWSSGSFPVPVETASAVARRRGQGRPVGRRGTRLALGGVEHGRIMPKTRMDGISSRALRTIVALTFWLGAQVQPFPAKAQEPERDEIIAAAIEEASLRFGLPTPWIRGVLQQESRGQTRAISPKGAMGLMQLMPSTWRDLSAELALGTDPFEPRANILAGSAYLRRMYDRYGSPGFLAAYNAGPARYDRYLAGLASLPAETREYVRALGPRLGKSTASPEPVSAPNWRASALFISPGEAFGGWSRRP